MGGREVGRVSLARTAKYFNRDTSSMARLVERLAEFSHDASDVEVGMRKLITGMKISVDGKIEGPDGTADWVEAWSDDYGLLPQVDACVLGGAMYPGYEGYWTAIRNEPDKPVWISGNAPTPAEIEWARFAAETPHYVLSNTVTSARWPKTSFVRGLEEIAALKQQPGKDIYLVGGARTAASLIDAGLVDEIRLIVYPLIAGEGKSLFATTARRRGLELRKVQQLQGGRVSLIYGIG
jgi:dihydrofolate reductase